MEIEIEQGALNLAIRIAHIEIEDIMVGPSNREIFNTLETEVREELKARFRSPVQIPRNRTIKTYRDLYWKMGIDPTKQRPSSEALLRRVLKKGLPSINTLVDAGNLASASTLVPIGIYDLDRIEGVLVLRVTKEGELFEGIGGAEKVMSKGHPVLADERGIIHLYPYRDAMRTRITERCERALLVACGVKGTQKGLLDTAIDTALENFDALEGA